MAESQVKIIGRQITAARGLLGLSLSDLAAAVDITDTSLSRIEHGKAMARERTLAAIRLALENRGIEFTNGNDPGVRLRRDKAIIPS
jgi:transcriptional regulator with XRE-family HTH domain